MEQLTNGGEICRIESIFLDDLQAKTEINEFARI
jgi:hypothetical protein